VWILFDVSEDLILNRYTQYIGASIKMFKKFRDRIALSGVTVLFIGVALLIFTFFSAYALLTADLSPISTQDLVQTFGESLGPLIAAAIHIMYLGIMGWVSSLITIRGVAIVTHVPQPPQKPQPETPQTHQSQTQNVKATPANKKPAAKPSEPEMVVIPLEEMEQQPRAKKKTKR
jgi:hypothetical protein